MTSEDRGGSRTPQRWTDPIGLASIERFEARSAIEESLFSSYNHINESHESRAAGSEMKKTPMGEEASTGRSPGTFEMFSPETHAMFNSAKALDPGRDDVDVLVRRGNSPEDIPAGLLEKVCQDLEKRYGVAVKQHNLPRARLFFPAA